MSRCTECGAEMDACEASEYEECYNCRSGNNRPRHRVRNLTRRGTDEKGRRARSTRVLGGSAELPDETTAEDTDEQE